MFRRMAARSILGVFGLLAAARQPANRNRNEL